MAALPLKSEYGPTLGQLLSPRWRAASTGVRALVVAGTLALCGLAVGVVLTVLDAGLSHGGPVPFALHYRGLSRTTPDPGGYAKLVRYRNGHLTDSFAVGPLHLPSYTIGQNAELPLFAVGYVGDLARRIPEFRYEGEGKTQVNNVPAYAIYFATRVDGRLLFGRDVLLLPQRSGARDGLEITMLTEPSAQINTPVSVGGTGVLQLPLRSISLS